MLVKLVDALAHGVRAVVVLLATVMLASLSLQVFCRFVLGQALSWTEELALGCFSWSMLLAIALGLRELFHVRMDLLVDRLPADPHDVAVAAAITPIGGWTDLPF